MNKLLAEALSCGRKADGLDLGDYEKLSEFNIAPLIESVDHNGKTYVKFQPPVVAVPNDWDVLLDKKEQAKMSPAEREKFEEELLKIIHIKFEQNSEELPQKYFYPELLTFKEWGLVLNLNFSDPLLISQGEVADKVKIKLLRSYFLTPSAVHAKLQNGRQLAQIIDDEEYVTVIENLPKMLESQEDYELIKVSAKVMEDVLN